MDLVHVKGSSLLMHKAAFNKGYLLRIVPLSRRVSDLAFIQMPEHVEKLRQPYLLESAGVVLIFWPLKWVPTEEHDIQHHTRRPDINHLAIIVPLVGNDLRCCMQMACQLLCQQIL